MDKERQAAVEALREALQACESFGMVRDSSESVVTGAVICEDGTIQVVSE